MAYKKRSYSKKASRRTYKRKSYAKKAPRTSIKKMVKMEIARSQETKSNQFWLLDRPLYAVGNINFPDNVIPLGPNAVGPTITQGTGQGQRIGNVIKIKKAILKGVLNPTPQNATTNPTPKPTLVRMVLCYDREDPNDAFVPGNTMMQNGSSTNALLGLLSDMVRPYNTDRYRILAQRTFKLGFSQYAGTTTNVGNQGVNQAFSNNDFKLNQMFNMDVTKHMVTHVKFNDNLSVPQTRGLFMFFHLCNADGSSLDQAIIPAELSFGIDLQYDDA